MTDHRFLFPAITLAERIAAAGRRVWLYQFDWAPAESPWRACHCIDLPFVFGTMPAWNAPMLAGARKAQCRDLAAAMMRAWTTFARDGTPGDWPRYDAARRRTMRFAEIIGVAGDPGGVEERMAVRSG